MPGMDDTNGNIDRRLVRVEERLSEVQADVKELRSDVVSRIDGPPWERSLRGRMHILETESSAAKAVHAALDDLRAARRERFTRGEKIAGLLIGIALLGLNAIQVAFVIVTS